MENFIYIIHWAIAIVFIVLSYSPLKESSEYRFTKGRQNLEGLTFIISAIATIFVSAWFILLGLAAIVLFKISSKND